MASFASGVKQLGDVFSLKVIRLCTELNRANGKKIMAGKYEIGMSKAVCKEIAGYAVVISKTATTETWKISNIWFGYATYLYFQRWQIGKNSKLLKVETGKE